MSKNLNEINRNLAKEIISAGGDVSPLIVPAELTDSWALTNPSIIVDGKDIIVNLRAVEYTLIHSDKTQKYWSRWGPLTYCHAENMPALKTINFLCKLKNTYDQQKKIHPSVCSFNGWKYALYRCFSKKNLWK